MNRKVKSFSTHQGVFIHGWGTMGNHFPGLGRLKGLKMQTVEHGVYLEGPNLEKKGERIEAMIPYANIIVMVFETEEQ